MRINQLMNKIISGEKWETYYTSEERRQDDLRELEAERIMESLENSQAELRKLISK